MAALRVQLPGIERREKGFPDAETDEQQVPLLFVVPFIYPRFDPSL